MDLLIGKGYEGVIEARRPEKFMHIKIIFGMQIFMWIAN
jgi:hypothetical protein